MRQKAGQAILGNTFVSSGTHDPRYSRSLERYLLSLCGFKIEQQEIRNRQKLIIASGLSRERTLRQRKRQYQ